MQEDKIEYLKNINQAINAILSGAQEYKIGTRSVKYADLSVLMAERANLESEVQGTNFGFDTVTLLKRR